MPKLSIILPVYNVENYLQNCLTSVLNQSYDDFELIIIDDGSTDESLKICTEFSLRDDRIRLYTQGNCGVSTTRNRGLDLVRGEFVTFVDSDDEIDSNMYESMMAKFSETDIDVVVCGHRVVQQNTGLIEVKYGTRLLTGAEATRMILDDSLLPSFLWDKICRAEVWQGVRFPEGRIYEDLATTYKIFDKSRRVYIVDEIYYSYYRRPQSICLKPGEQNLKKRLYDLHLAFYDRYQFASSNNLYISMTPICAYASFQSIINLLHSSVRYKLSDDVNDYKDLATKLVVLYEECRTLFSLKRKIEVFFLKFPFIHRFLLKCYYFCKHISVR